MPVKFCLHRNDSDYGGFSVALEGFIGIYLYKKHSWIDVGKYTGVWICINKPLNKSFK
jgi:hypothetical protein